MAPDANYKYKMNPFMLNRICAGQLRNLLDAPAGADGQISRPALLYQYHCTRSGREMLKFLDEYHGYIKNDDFEGYDHLGQKLEIVHLAC